MSSEPERSTPLQVFQTNSLPQTGGGGQLRVEKKTDGENPIGEI